MFNRCDFCKKRISNGSSTKMGMLDYHRRCLWSLAHHLKLDYFMDPTVNAFTIRIQRSLK